jgi:hypothetical protein
MLWTLTAAAFCCAVLSTADTQNNHPAEAGRAVVWTAQWRPAGRIVVVPAFVAAQPGKAGELPGSDEMEARIHAARDLTAGLEARLNRAGALLVPQADVAAALRESGWKPSDLLQVLRQSTWTDPRFVRSVGGRQWLALSAPTELAASSSQGDLFRYTAPTLPEHVEGVFASEKWIPEVNMERVQALAEQLDADLVVFSFVTEHGSNFRMEKTGEKTTVTQNFGSLWNPDFDAPVGNTVLRFSTLRSFWWIKESFTRVSALVVRPSVGQVVRRLGAVGRSLEDGPADSSSSARRLNASTATVRLSLMPAVERLSGDLINGILKPWAPSVFLQLK